MLNLQCVIYSGWPTWHTTQRYGHESPQPNRIHFVVPKPTCERQHGATGHLEWQEIHKRKIIQEARLNVCVSANSSVGAMNNLWDKIYKPINCFSRISFRSLPYWLCLHCYWICWFCRTLVVTTHKTIINIETCLTFRIWAGEEKNHTFNTTYPKGKSLRIMFQRHPTNSGWLELQRKNDQMRLHHQFVCILLKAFFNTSLQYFLKEKVDVLTQLRPAAFSPVSCVQSQKRWLTPHVSLHHSVAA